MDLKSFWERNRAQRWQRAEAAPAPARPELPKPFEPLTREASLAVLEHALEWLIEETTATLAMPSGPAKARRWAELRARDQSMARDFRRLFREQQ